MLALIEDLENIENHGMNSDTGDEEDCSFLLTQVNMRENEVSTQMQIKSIKNSSFLFKKIALDNSDVTVFDDNKYLVNYMVIQDWHLVRKLPRRTIFGGLEVGF